jgi:hypothetical protein
MIRMVVSTIAISVIALFSISSFAGDDFNGNKRKGKYLLRKVYKKCKKRGEVESATPKISPSDKTMKDWSAIYKTLKSGDQKKIAETMKPFGCTPEWKALKDKAMLDIFTYMYKHAQDSSTPAKCK